MTASRKVSSKGALWLSVLALAFGGSFKPSIASDKGNRIKFQIRMIEEISGQRKVLSEASVEGPLGTDFNIGLQSLHFKLDSRFRTDLNAAGGLTVRATLNTRRLYGYSERGLPLYEEDSQRIPLQLGFDESILMLPFGQDEGPDKLKIEITPALVDGNNLSPEMAQTPQINISKPAPDGLISIQAFKIPHRFEVEAILLEEGREVARGRSVFLLDDEQKDLPLRPNELASQAVAEEPLIVKLGMDNYAPVQPVGQVNIGFDVLRARALAQPEAVAVGWAGTGLPGRELNYDLGQIYQPRDGGNYHLRFKIRLADGE